MRTCTYVIYVHYIRSTIYNFAVNESSETVSEHNTNNTNERHCEVFIGLAVVFIVTSVITTTIIVILSWKLCSQKRNHGKLLYTV